MPRGSRLYGLPSIGSYTSPFRVRTGPAVERVHARRDRVRHQQHVGSLDALPAGDRRAVEGVSELELLLVEVLYRHRHVLLLAAGIGKPEVDELDLLFLDELQDVIGR